MIYISQHNSKECLVEFLNYYFRFENGICGDGIVQQMEDHYERQKFKERFYSNDMRYWSRECDTKLIRQAELEKFYNEQWLILMSKIE